MSGRPNLEVNKMEDAPVIVQNPYSRLREVPDIELIENAIFKRVSNLNLAKGAGPKNLAKAKVSLFVRLYENRTKKIADLYKLAKSAHDFHVSLCDSIYEGGHDQLVRDFEVILKSRIILRRLSNEYLKKIDYEPDQVNLLKTEFLGRAGSVIRRLKPAFKRLNTYSRLLSDLPTINTTVFKVVVAGVPHVGKSSLVSNLTSRRIKIGSYPFTTKEINAGELVDGLTRAVIYDTPGLLDRSLSERNKIEIRAIAALKYLADMVIFIVDPTEKAGYPVAYQETVMEEVKRVLKNVEPIKVYTHADEFTDLPSNSICVSNTTLYGIEILKKIILEKAHEWYNSRFSWVS
jgi:nucleolar GTP-binding protein